MKICLTGGIACGKSLLSRYLNEFGVATIDADDIVHELIPDPAERRRLAAEVFADPVKRKALEARLHPVVKERIEAFLGAGAPVDLRDAGDARDERPSSPSCRSCHRPASLPLPRLAVIPLLFEAHWEKNFDIICCIASDRETQISRMMTTRGYTRAEAEARLAAQMPVAEKAAKSHYVIHNDGTPEELKEQVREFLTWLKNLTYLQGQ